MPKQVITQTSPGEIRLPDEIGEDERSQVKRHEIFGVLSGIAALFFTLSLISYDGRTAEEVFTGAGNYMGAAGQWTAYFLFSLLGVTSYLLMAFVWVTAGSLFVPKAETGRAKSALGMLLISAFASVLLHTVLKGTLILSHPSGGYIGELLGELSLSVFATGGTYLVSIGAILVTLLVITDISIVKAAQTGVFASGSMLLAAARFARRVVEAWKIDPEEERPAEEEKTQITIIPKAKEKKEKSKPPLSPVPDIVPDDAVDDSVNEDNETRKSVGTPESSRKLEKNTDPLIVKNIPKKPGKIEKAADAGITINSAPVCGHFQLPPLDLISGSPEESEETDIDETHLKELADKLVQVLSDFNVYGEVREIHPGPVVTMFEFQPRSGTKLSKIESLSSELAMVLEVIRVRVVAPIPGKHAVGFELPNKKRETVFLKDMLLDDSFTNPKHKLPLALGRDIAGNPMAVDLAKMPHLLIAGTTGSGKSVSVNAMLLSLLYKYTPEDLRFLMVDPKMIELGIYDHIPHLLLPVVTDMSKACLALKWAVDEMERRYQLFADVGVRNLAAYNKKIEMLKAEHSVKTPEEKRALMSEDGFSIEDEQVVVVSSASSNPQALEKLPFIVVVVDELADLMMVAAKDVETSIARLAQKARASGIHLIIATQRPSVDVITGLIKANFPSRISFRVSSGTDSRTILGTIGAENLLGMGDMLILPPGTSDLTRVHGAFVEDEEIHKVVAFLKAQGRPQYDEKILKPRDEDMEDFDEIEKDEVYDQAVAIVAETQTCSISMLQRRLRIGYNRSARIVEIMEKEGVVGPANGVNKRDVLIAAHFDE
jgi:S-DNA-T family DNA segregation ATPase FtsK/SpoIIIE